MDDTLDYTLDDTSLACELARLAERMHHAPDPEHTAGAVVAYACDQLGADRGGITLIRAGHRLETVAPTDPIVEQADSLQHELGEGPCHDSAWEGETLVAQDLAADPRWPRWGPVAVDLGLRSALGVELLDRDGQRRLGAVNLYWDHARIFTYDEIALAHLIARHAALALESSLTVEGLRVAMDGRKRIGQAQGILMERHGLDEEQAFAVLKRFSQDQNIKLRDLAEELVRTMQLPDDRRAHRRALGRLADDSADGAPPRPSDDASGQGAGAHQGERHQHQGEQPQA